ncbi:hypothetical protein [Paenibacillus silviterrae]|uniref:hypothetical protein n=1 Tax=Paenibacillus silviterrae TaxID=3242194 RepID=UPI0025436336|nr:hypothetical protein [Paenibacillus chinjuensis]
MTDPRVFTLLIDCQEDFMEGGALPVTGARADMARLAAFIAKHRHTITRIGYSLDTHQPISIFFPCWWRNGSGEHPAPFTLITKEEVQEGLWMPIYDREQSMACLHHLGAVMIWTYHCLQGSAGAALEGTIQQAVTEHALATQTNPYVLTKGLDRVSEMYGIVHPEHNPHGLTHRELLDEIALYDRTIIAGEAASHCVLTSVRQICEGLADLELTKRITVLTDCMSPIAGFEEQMTAGFAELERKYRIQLVKSTEV